MSTTIIFILLFCLNKCQSYLQHDYTLKHERIELAGFNEKLSNVKLYNTKLNRTTRSFGALVEFVDDLHPTNFRFVLQGYKYLNNEYKLFPPLRCSINVCTAFQRNWFDLKSFTTTNGNFTTCPIKKGTYYLKNYVPPADNFPPLIPAGDWRADLILNSNDDYLFTIAWYGGVQKIKSIK